MDEVSGRCRARFHTHYVEKQSHAKSCGLTAIRLALAELTQSKLGLPFDTALCREGGQDLTTVATNGLTTPQMEKLLQGQRRNVKSFTGKDSRALINGDEDGYRKWPAICLLVGASAAAGGDGHWVVVADEMRDGASEYFCVIDPADEGVYSVQIASGTDRAPYEGTNARGMTFAPRVIRFPT